jgi:Cdc6-like AAA superfamily ATPase
MSITGAAPISAAQRLHQIENLVIHFPRLKRVREQLAWCQQHSRLTAEPECLLITGPTGAGKTTLCQAYARQQPRRATAEGIVMPVVTAAIPVPATAKSLATRLLVALGDPLAERGTTVQQTLRLTRLLKAYRVELLILDEFQHFIDRDSNHILLTVANWLKDLLNETNVPLVLTGMPYSEVILQANAQLERRFQQRLRLAPFGWETAAQQIELRIFLQHVDEALPFTEVAHLSDTEMARRIYCATAGVTGAVMKLVRRAAVLAVTRGTTRLTQALLAEAYDERLAAGNQHLPHPFRAPLTQLKVVPLRDREFTGKLQAYGSASMEVAQ